MQDDNIYKLTARTARKLENKQVRGTGEVILCYLFEKSLLEKIVKKVVDKIDTICYY